MRARRENDAPHERAKLVDTERGRLASTQRSASDVRQAALERLSSILDVEDVATALDGATQLAVDALHADVGLAVELDPTATTVGDRRGERCGVGFRGPPGGDARPGAVDIFAYADAVGATVVVDDLSRESRFDTRDLLDEGLMTCACAVIRLPVAGQMSPCGGIFAGSRSRRPFDGADVSVLESIASAVGTVVRRRQLGSELARLVAEVERQRDLFVALVEQFPVGVVLAESDGNISLVSKQMTNMWQHGLGPFEPIRGHAGRYVAWYPDGRRLRDEDYAHARALRGETVRQEIIYERSDGKRFDLLDIGAPLRDRRGAIIGSVVAVNDVSAEKARRDERERLLTETKEAVRARDDILAIVSHDLRNPVNVIALAASLLDEEAHSAPSQTIRVMTGRIRRAATDIQKLIGDLLDQALIDQRRLLVEVEDHDAAQLLGEAVDAFTEVAAARGVELRKRVDALTGVTLSCDAGRMMQVMSNLIGNALKFVPPGRGIEVSGRATPDDVVVSIQDEGPGIRPEQLPYVFDRYWQPDAKSTKSGLGLGLSIVKGIVEAHGGAVSVVSSPGHGATFEFRLPRRPHT